MSTCHVCGQLATEHDSSKCPGPLQWPLPVDRYQPMGLPLYRATVWLTVEGFAPSPPVIWVRAAPSACDFRDLVTRIVNQHFTHTEAWVKSGDGSKPVDITFGPIGRSWSEGV